MNGVAIVVEGGDGSLTIVCDGSDPTLEWEKRDPAAALTGLRETLDNLVRLPALMLERIWQPLGAMARQWLRAHETDRGVRRSAPASRPREHRSGRSSLRRGPPDDPDPEPPGPSGGWSVEEVWERAQFLEPGELKRLEDLVWCRRRWLLGVPRSELRRDVEGRWSR